MNLKFNKFNMKYGWLGRQASLNVGYTISIKEFKEFKKYYEEVMNKDLSEFNSFYKDILLPMVVGSAAPIVMSLNYRKKMREDLYSCLTYIFFRDGLSEFLAD